MTQSKRIAVCILRYLKDELGETSMVSDENKESLEVAIQCLESVYEVGPDDLAALAVKKSLPEMFASCTTNERTCFKPAQPQASAPPPKREPNPEAEAAKQRGNELLKAEKYQEALEMYSKAIDLDPHNAVYFCNRAATFSKLEKGLEAIEDCEAALAIDPQYSKAYARMGLAWASVGDHQKALECYENALLIDPNNESYKNNVRVARDQLPGGNMGGAPNGDANGGLGGIAAALGGLGGLGDFSQLLGNPALMNMATQIMQDPGMQNLMSNIMAGTLNAGQQPPPTNQPPPATAPNDTQNPQPQSDNGGINFENLLRAGQQFAQQMQTSNGPLIDQLRREMDSRGMNPPGSGTGNNPQNNPPS